MTDTIAIAELMPAAPAPLVGVGWAAETYEIAIATVHSAIQDGRLPATAVPGGRGRVVYAIRPEDAFKLWGSRYVARQLAAAAVAATND